MNIEQTLHSIKQNNFQNNYLLYGEESFFIDKISNLLIQNVIPDSEKIFNQQVIYGKQIDVDNLITNLKLFPMVGQKRLIVLKEAQKILNISNLDKYLSHPTMSTIFVICYKSKSVDKRKSWIKSVEKNGIIVECKTLYNNQIPRWINYELIEKKMNIETSAEALLIEFLGNDMSKIMNAIDKLSKVVNSKNITEDDILKHIGIHRDYNIFELQSAISEKDNKRVFSIIHYFNTNQKKFPIPMITSALFSFFSKILIMHSNINSNEKELAKILSVHPYFLSNYRKGVRNFNFERCVEIISILKETDLKSKGIGGNFDYSLTVDMLIKIISK